MLEENDRILSEKLLGNSKAAMIAAIEVYNKPVFEYRDECTVILLLNAWELVLKSLLVHNGDSIYYPKDHISRTLSWKDSLKNCEKYFPQSVEYSSTMENLKQLEEFRNNAIHFYNEKDLKILIYSLLQTSIKNYYDLVLAVFQVDISREINWILLPLGVVPPVDVMTYISQKQYSASNEHVERFVSQLESALEKQSENGDINRLLTVFKVRIESVKKSNLKQDAVVGFVQQSVAPTGVQAIIKKQDPNDTHPFRQKEILQKVTRIGHINLNSYSFQAIVWKFKIKEDSHYCWISSRGELTRYSHYFITFLEKLTIDQIDQSLADYREHKKLLRSQKRSSSSSQSNNAP